MSEYLSKLSSDDIRRFEKSVSEAKALTVRQEEIAKKVLEVEKDIGKVRLASLDEYFDAYSKGLDDIIARKTSKLNDAFLIMEQKALESFKKSLGEPVDAPHKTTASKSKSADQKADDNTTHKAARIFIKELKDAGYLIDAAKGPERQAAYKDSGDNGKKPPINTGGSDGGSDNDEDVEVYQTQGESATNKMGDADTAATHGIIERLSAFNKKTFEEQLNDFSKSTEAKEQIEALRAKNHEEHVKKYEEREKALAGSITALMLARQQTAKKSYEDQEAWDDKLKDLRIANLQEVAEAELDAQNFVNKIETERAYVDGNIDEVANLRAKRSAAEDLQKSLQQTEKARLDYIAKEELKAKRKNDGILKAEDAKEIQKQANKKFKLDTANLEKLAKRRAAHDAHEAEKSQRTQMRQDLNALRTGDWYERKEALYNLTHDEAGNADIAKAVSAVGTAVVNGLSNFAKKLETTIDEIGKYKGEIDTRLRGSEANLKHDGSYWEKIVKDMTSIGAVNPYFRQSDFASNIKSLVDQGIAFDLEQRAFLMTIQGKIANTFDVADGTLLKLIRIQQEDTTAGRLGMEAALNSFLNEMYENTEYLKQVADSVRGSLAEMQSLMEGAEAAEVEYQVQKWLGSLYSVGMSDTAVNSISSALGQIAAGQIEGLTNGGAGNLLIMAANEAGLSIADILTEGINSEKTNELMQAVVNYLAEIAESSKGNNVVQQQLADVFGVKASDLRAATNLSTKNSISTVYDNSRTYENMLYELTSMANTMGDRTSLSEMMTNIWENVQYSISGGIAEDPAMYFLYNVASVLDDAVGGIGIPSISVAGFGVDLETTVADLMRVVSVSGGILGSFGDLISGLGSSFNGQAMLEKLGIESGAGIAVTRRGDGSLNMQTGGGSTSTSGSGYVGNASGSDIKNSTMQEANDQKKQLMVEAQESEEANQIDTLNATVLKIYELLNDVTNGNGCFRVKVESYGLTKAGGGSAQGGVGALGNLNDSGNYSGTSSGASSGSLAGGGVNSGGIGGSVNFGGWTTVI